MNKTKQKLIKQILQESDIHHNISINFSKLADYSQEEGSIWQNTANNVLEDFISDWRYRKINDSGNRNLCSCRKDKPSNIIKAGACIQHDLWHLYTSGRSGATLYWDKYWNESRLKDHEYDLEQKSTDELKTMLKEITTFKDAVKEMMKHFYYQFEADLKDFRAERKAEEQHEADYEAVKAKVVELGCIKRLVTEIL